MFNNMQESNCHLVEIKDSIWINKQWQECYKCQKEIKCELLQILETENRIIFKF